MAASGSLSLRAGYCGTSCSRWRRSRYPVVLGNTSTDSLRFSSSSPAFYHRSPWLLRTRADLCGWGRHGREVERERRRKRRRGLVPPHRCRTVRAVDCRVCREAQAPLRVPLSLPCLHQSSFHLEDLSGKQTLLPASAYPVRTPTSASPCPAMAKEKKGRRGSLFTAVAQTTGELETGIATPACSWIS